MIKAQCSKDLHIPIRQAEKICHYIFGSDLDFYEEYLIDLLDEEQERFFDNNTNFMCDFPVKRDKIYLLKDRMFRMILRKIGKREGGKG